MIGRSDFLSSFDVLLDESETGVAKPDPRAYDQAAAAMGLDPAAIVFVDDDPANIAGAGAAGMAGVHFDVADPAGSFGRVGATSACDPAGRGVRPGADRFGELWRPAGPGRGRWWRCSTAGSGGRGGPWS